MHLGFVYYNKGFIMNTRKISQEKLTASDFIVTNNITGYMDKICTGLLISLIYVLLSEVFMFCVIKFTNTAFTSDILFLKNRWIPNTEYLIRHIIIPNTINWISYLTFRLIYKRVGFTAKRVSVCVIYILCTTIYAFAHWGFIYLSMLYCIPVILACPLGRKTHNRVFAVSIILQLIYSVYQYRLSPSVYHLLVEAMSLTTLIAFYCITICVYNTLMHALSDVKAYEKLNTDLKVRLHHDNLTGAYSKSALMNEEATINSYSTITFIDLDNFKIINDTYGHSMGDQILKTLVCTFQDDGETIFRYGGDEFIVLSHIYKEEFASKLVKIKSDFISRCEKSFHLTSTFSAGVVEIKEGSSLKSLLTASDKLMYNAKNNGKNQVHSE